MRKIIEKPEWKQFYYKSAQIPGQQKIENEAFEVELEKVKFCLNELKNAGFINSIDYDIELFKKFRKKVNENFFIYWTAINPPMEHLLFALSYILKPKNILGLGIFTGNPVVWSMGPALEGVYESEMLTAVEINKKHANKCRENFEQFKEWKENTNNKGVNVLGADGFKVIKEFDDNSIDLLYLDANGRDPYSKATGFFAKRKNTKRINYSLLKDALPKIKSGAFAMCHNAGMPSFKRDAADYLTLTADETYFEKTSTINIDEMGLEFSIRK